MLWMFYFICGGFVGEGEGEGVSGRIAFSLGRGALFLWLGGVCVSGRDGGGEGRVGEIGGGKREKGRVEEGGERG